MFKVSKILVPVDFSDCSRAALSHALSLAGQVGASIDVAENVVRMAPCPVLTVRAE